MGREPLPDRRNCWRQRGRLDNQTIFLSFGEYPDGRLGEVWIDASKQGTLTRGALESLARSVSMSLQNGVPAAEVVRMLRELNFPPNGPLAAEFSPVNGVEVASVSDWLAREIEAAYVAPAMPAGPIFVPSARPAGKIPGGSGA